MVMVSNLDPSTDIQPLGDICLRWPMDSRERIVELYDGTRLWTAASGTGPPVIACHGGPGLWDYLAPLADLLDDQLTVVRYDQRGCGRSGGEGPYTIDQAVDDLEQLRIAYAFDGIGVLGHSWGAELALRYAARHADYTRAVAYIAGVGDDQDFRPTHSAEVARRLGSEVDRWRELASRQRNAEEEREFCLLQWRPDFSPSSDVRAHAEALWRTRPDGVEVNTRANRELWADRVNPPLVDVLGEVSAPVLMLFGADDPRPWTSTNPIYVALADTVVVRRVVLDDAGHAPWVEQPEAVRSLALELLRY